MTAGRFFLRFTAAAGLAGLLSACAPTRALSDPWPRRFDQHQQVEFWTGGAPVRLHGVLVRGDTVTGIPAAEPLGCSGCAVALPRPAIDSARYVTRDGPTIGTAALAVGTLAAFIAVWNLTTVVEWMK